MGRHIVGEPAQQASQVLAVLIGPAGDGLGEPADQGARIAVGCLRALGGRLDEAGPSVVRVTDAAHQTAPLQPLYLPGDVRADDLHSFRDLADPQWLAGQVQRHQDRHRGPVREGDPGSLHGPLGQPAPAECAAQLCQAGHDGQHVRLGRSVSTPAGSPSWTRRAT